MAPDSHELHSRLLPNGGFHLKFMRGSTLSHNTQQNTHAQRQAGHSGERIKLVIQRVAIEQGKGTLSPP